MGFVSNNLANGRAFRILMTMRPIGARVRVGRSRSVHEGMGVVRALEKAKAERDSLPKKRHRRVLATRNNGNRDALTG